MDVAAQPVALRRVEPPSHPGGDIIRVTDARQKRSTRRALSVRAAISSGVTDARQKHSRGNFSPKRAHFCRPAVVAGASVSAPASSPRARRGVRSGGRACPSNIDRVDARRLASRKGGEDGLRRLLTQPCSVPLAYWVQRLRRGQSAGSGEPSGVQTQAPIGRHLRDKPGEVAVARAETDWSSGVYGSDDKQIGKIDDLLLDKNAALPKRS